MELKSVMQQRMGATDGFNRTFMELKYITSEGSRGEQWF